jgi:hypothetical protein
MTDRNIVRLPLPSSRVNLDPVQREALTHAVLEAFRTGAVIAPELSHPFHFKPGAWESSISAEATLELLTATPEALDLVLSAVQGLIEQGVLTAASWTAPVLEARSLTPPGRQ